MRLQSLPHPLRRTLIGVTLLCLSISAASAKDIKDPVAPLALKKIVLVPVLESRHLTIENRGSALDLLALPGYAIHKAVQSDRATELMQCMRTDGLNLGRDMTDAFILAFRKSGFSVEILNEVPRNGDDPEDVDYDRLHVDADAIVNVYYDEVGLYDGRLSMHYIPRMNVSAEIVSPSTHATIKSMSVEYGVDAKTKNEEAIPTDPKYAYASFSEVMEQHQALAECYRTGMHEIAETMAAHLNDAPKD